MFLHKKELIHPVNVTEPSPKFAQFLLEQFGGATGELPPAYSILPRRSTPTMIICATC